jgi:hypothetical protein
MALCRRPARPQPRGGRRAARTSRRRMARLQGALPLALLLRHTVKVRLCGRGAQGFAAVRAGSPGGAAARRGRAHHCGTGQAAVE